MAPTVRPVAPESGNLTRPDELGECARYLAWLDQLVSASGVADGQYARVPGYPYLRTNRLLSSSVEPGADTALLDVWVDALMALGSEARGIEHANLPESVRAQVDETRAQECSANLRRVDLADQDAKLKLRETIATPDSYQFLQRVFGLYPITSIPFEMGVKRWHDQLQEILSHPRPDLPVLGTLTRYVPQTTMPGLSPQQVSDIIHRASHHPLGIPTPGQQEQIGLFETFAPIWEVDTVTNDDYLGTPYWPRNANAPAVNASQPVTYTLVSHTRLGGEILLQLNYVMWFPARPRSGRLDLLGGAVDGITWRVTLHTDGKVAFYDTIHNCGCYHIVFPTSKVRVLRHETRHEEPLLVAPNESARIGHAVIRIQSGSHYIHNVSFGEESDSVTTAYPLRSYHELRSLPLLRGRRSFFGPDGLVAGTERAERWLFWPMGVPEPGAMRQWGTHAIAFVGRRHFDDPMLFAPYLQLR